MPDEVQVSGSSSRVYESERPKKKLKSVSAGSSSEVAHIDKIRFMCREMCIVRRILYGSVKPYFDGGHFLWCFPRTHARHLVASRAAGCAGRNAGADEGNVLLKCDALGDCL
jgi:hypothetical protein